MQSAKTQSYGAPVATIGRSIGLNQQSTAITLTQDFSENIIVWGANRQEQATATAINALVSLMAYYEQSNTPCNFIVLDCTNNPMSQCKPLLAELEKRAYCKIIQALVRQYNEEMNSIRPREYDGSHIVFAGMNPEITLREHQRNAIAHVLYGGNTLLAHEVGAGKTFEMVAAAMESKRLGLCQKSIFVVPNHLTEQWASEFLRLYPSANILVTKQRDFETKNRKKFCARL